MEVTDLRSASSRLGRKNREIQSQQDFLSITLISSVVGSKQNFRAKEKDKFAKNQ